MSTLELVPANSLWHTRKSWSIPPTRVETTCGLDLPGGVEVRDADVIPDDQRCSECDRITAEATKPLAEMVAKTIVEDWIANGLQMTTRELVESAVEVAHRHAAGGDANEALDRLVRAVERARAEDAKYREG